MDLTAYQRMARETDVRADRDDPTLPLLGLAGEVGSVVAEYKKKLRGSAYTSFEDEVTEDLGDLLWYAATLATTLGLSLDDIAAANVKKTAAMWGTSVDPPERYDSGFPAHQQLPRQFTTRFVSVEGEDGLPRVKIYLGPDPVGDPLDDNTYEEDHYRFHDCFHLANAAVLGWSPVFRWMLKAKRKANPTTDRVEDGARAMALEEGLVAFVFSEAAQRGFFEGHARIDWDLLKMVRRMVANLEVGDQSPNAWNRAILQGYEVWRELREHAGGLVIGDLDARTIRFEAAKGVSS